MSRVSGGFTALFLVAVLAVLLIVACSEEEPESEQSSRGDSNCPEDPPPFIEDDFPQPEFRRSEDGVLQTTLRAANETVTIDGGEYTTQAYENSYPGPMLVVCPGDRMVVNFENDLDEDPTNLHTHGFHVSPEGNSDNIFLDVKPGEKFTYEYDIPEDESPGAYWYHPHYHGLTDPQVFAGMAGPIIIEGGLDEMPGIREIPQRVLAIQTTQLGDGRVVPVAQSKTSEQEVFVNGVNNPDIDIRPGELQRWRIYNMNSDDFLNLRLEGQDFQLLATDGNTLEDVQSMDEMLVAPGSRREVLVRGGDPGEYELKALRFTPFPDGTVPEATVATLVSDDTVDAAEDQAEPEGPLEEQEDLRDVPIDREREINYTERISGDDFRFLINDRMFDHDRIDQTMILGDTEEWTINNETNEWHTFHIHVNDFQIVEMGGEPTESIEPQDNVAIPPKTSVKLRMRFEDFTGKFVFHCHVLFHEDNGMMSVVQVVDPDSPEATAAFSDEPIETTTNHDHGDH